MNATIERRSGIGPRRFPSRTRRYVDDSRFIETTSGTRARSAIYEYSSYATRARFFIERALAYTNNNRNNRAVARNDNRVSYYRIFAGGADVSNTKRETCIWADEKVVRALSRRPETLFLIPTVTENTVYIFPGRAIFARRLYNTHEVGGTRGKKKRKKGTKAFINLFTY